MGAGFLFALAQSAAMGGIAVGAPAVMAAGVAGGAIARAMDKDERDEGDGDGRGNPKV